MIMEKISIIIPCFNEDGNIDYIYNQVINVINGCEYELIFVDDGSIDNTLDKIHAIAETDKRVRYISFSRNFGHQNAIKAGYDHSIGDCAISLDADGQHPVSLMPELIAKWRDGYDVVFTLRDDKKNTGIFKRLTAWFFYKIVNILSDTKVHPGASDFRLIDRKVIDELKNFSEESLFYRGLIPWLGFKQTGISYIPDKRNSGKTKYSLRKMISFASSGITSFSIKPLHLSIYLGFFFASMAILYGLYAIYVAIFTNEAVIGWTSLIASIMFIGGLQFIIIGIIGEYLGKLFINNKKRPHYIISQSNIN
jgi:polyisoprenyl-phosphate glycosyltransferase